MTDPRMRVWWIPQVPGKPFHTEVADSAEAVRVISILAEYDLFQAEHYIRPDFSNAGGIEVFEDDEWVDYPTHTGGHAKEYST